MSALIVKNLLRHPVRSLLTVGAMAIAFFLLCLLTSMVTTLKAGLDPAIAQRLVTQSAVSLFVNLPPSYQAKIEEVEGVRETCGWTWFGGYYKERKNFFAQFATDPEEMLDIYPEIKLIEGSRSDFASNKTACIIGKDLVELFEGRGIGDRVPILSEIYPRRDGTAWEFEIAGIYESNQPTVDDKTLFFHWDWLVEYQEEEIGITPGPSTVVIDLEQGVQPIDVMSSIDTMYENGPQRTTTTTEAEFTRQFLTMLGDLPTMLGAIGTGVFLAILLAVVNTMLLTAREQAHDVGVLKALGFSDRSVFGLLLAQSLFLAAIGGALGICLALVTEPFFESAFQSNLPGYTVRTETVVMAVVLTAATGLIAGLLPAWRAKQLSVVQALRAGA